MKPLKRTWADVQLDHLEYNYQALRAKAGPQAKFLGVVKADAYGHGAAPIGRALESMGAECFAVSNLEEAVQLRRGKLHAPILILGYTPPEYAQELVCLDITQEVHSLCYARALENMLAGTRMMLNIHLKFDSGMTRIGFFTDQPEQTMQEIMEISQMPHLHISGAFTHFCSADSLQPDDVAFTKMQYESFLKILDDMKAAGIEPETRHCCNSGATILHPEFAMDMVRPGIATFGHHPSKDTVGEIDLRPVMSLHTCIAQVRTVPAGKSISYGRSYVTDEPRRVAVLPIGYADGLSRALSNRVSFRICGKDAPVLGRICMDMCMVDVTDIPQAEEGVTATLFGYDEEGVLVPCERIADMLGTIIYEVLCGINKRIPRIYSADGESREILQYIV